MRYMARALTWGLVGCRGRARRLLNDIEDARLWMYSDRLLIDLRPTVDVAERFLEATDDARFLTSVIGWSTIMGRSTQLDLSIASTLQRALQLTEANALLVDQELRMARDAALSEARSEVGHYRRTARTFAHSVESARREFNGFARDFDPIMAGRFVKALVSGFDRTLQPDSSYDPPGPVVERLLVAAVTLLPLEHRARYDEEFLAEAADLPRNKRLAHAIRTVWSCAALRLTLSDSPY